ncbi:MAG: hypothetical protein KGZ64_04845 [Thermaerobacter sp.]|nr:hypothetical protein [Thermaerobacter sp.]
MYRVIISTMAILTLLATVFATSVTATPWQMAEEEVEVLHDLDPGSGGGLAARGNVVFRIGHSCAPALLGMRSWLTGEARNWDMFGTLSTDGFLHQHGYEFAHFAGVVAGPSRGDARITRGWGTCQACSTGMQHYYVPRSGTIEVRMVMAP